jgi:excisionase family DNA binding protein
VDDGLFDVSALDDFIADLPARIDADQVAQVLGVTGGTVRRLITDDDPDPLPAYRIGRTWMVLRDEFKEWLMRHRSNPNV